MRDGKSDVQAGKPQEKGREGQIGGVDGTRGQGSKPPSFYRASIAKREAVCAACAVGRSGENKPGRPNESESQEDPWALNGRTGVARALWWLSEWPWPDALVWSVVALTSALGAAVHVLASAKGDGAHDAFSLVASIRRQCGRFVGEAAGELARVLLGHQGAGHYWEPQPDDREARIPWWIFGVGELDEETLAGTEHPAAIAHELARMHLFAGLALFATLSVRAIARRPEGAAAPSFEVVASYFVEANFWAFVAAVERGDAWAKPYGYSTARPELRAEAYREHAVKLWKQSEVAVREGAARAAFERLARAEGLPRE